MSGGKCPGGTCPGGFCPVTLYNTFQFEKKWPMP